MDEFDFKPSLTFIESRFQLDEQLYMLYCAFSNSNDQLILSQLNTILSFLEVGEWDPKSIISSNVLPLAVEYIKHCSKDPKETNIKVKKQILCFLCFITQKSEEVSLFFIHNNVFEKLSDLLLYRNDNITSVSVSRLFYNILNHGSSFAKLSNDTNVINIAKEAVMYFSNMKYGYTYVLYINGIMKLLNLLLSYEIEIDDMLIFSLSNSYVSILSKIISLQLNNIKINLDSFITFFIESSNFVSIVSQYYQEYGNELFQSRIISILNNQLSTKIFSNAWSSILAADINLLKALTHDSEEMREIHDQIIPHIIYPMLINNQITEEWNSSALQIFALMISKEESILETFDMNYLYESIMSLYDDLPFLPQREIMRLSFTIILKPNQLDLLELLIEKGIFQNFAVLLENVSNDLIILALTSIQTALEASSWVPQKYNSLKEILNDEYKDLFEEWHNNIEDDMISNLSGNLLDTIS